MPFQHFHIWRSMFSLSARPVLGALSTDAVPVLFSPCSVLRSMSPYYPSFWIPLRHHARLDSSCSSCAGAGANACLAVPTRTRCLNPELASPVAMPPPVPFQVLVSVSLISSPTSDPHCIAYRVRTWISGMMGDLTRDPWLRLHFRCDPLALASLRTEAARQANCLVPHEIEPSPI